MSRTSTERAATPGRPKRPPRQVDRVAKFGLAAGSRGTCQAEWLAPGGADGRGRVTRLASRVAELRAAGWRIRTAGKRQGFKVYVFERPPAATVAPSAPAPDPTLFERAIGAPPPRCAVEPWEEE